MAINKLRKTAAAVITLVLAACVVIGTTLAWVNDDDIINEFPGDGSALLQKYETGTETPVPDAQFGLYRLEEDGTPTLVQTFTTGTDGKILATDLGPGDYYWQETSPAPGFLPELEGGQPKKYHFSIPSGEDGPVLRVAYNTRRQDTLALTKTVLNSDGSALTQAQRDTLFEFTVTFSDGGSYAYIINGGAAQTVASGGKLYLKSGQTAQFDGISAGVGYSFAETPVTGYVTTSQNHANTVPEGGITASFTNTYTVTPPAHGSLTVTKTVTGDGADLELEFEFTAVIGGVEHPFTLKHGQSKTFTDIPLGTAYTVTEADYTAEGYTLTAGPYSGTIQTGGVNITLPFINHYEGDNPQPGGLEITKTVTGPDASHDKEFTFTVTFEGEGAPASPQTFTLTHGQTKTFEDIPRGVRYTVTETPEDGYRPDFITASGTIAANHTAKINFINRKPNEPKLDWWIAVTKIVEGDPPASESDRLFHFILTINGTEYPFSLKAGESSDTFIAQTGDTYSLVELNTPGYIKGGVINGSGTVGTENIEIIQTNTYISPETIDIEGEKTWQAPAGTQLPGSVTILLKNGTATVRTATTDQSKNWRYKFENLPRRDALGNVIPYTVEEVRIPGWRPIVTGYNITNHHQPPVIDEAIEVEKAIVGTPTENPHFKFILTPINDAPMPGNDELFITGAGKSIFGRITYTVPGTYIYTITETPGNLANWTYDA